MSYQHITFYNIRIKSHLRTNIIILKELNMTTIETKVINKIHHSQKIVLLNILAFIEYSCYIEIPQRPVLDLDL